MRTALQKHPCKSQINFIQPIINNIVDRGGGYSHTLPIWVCATQRGRDFEGPDLEWGIHFRGVF